jgi:hypothetical protein
MGLIRFESSTLSCIALRASIPDRPGQFSETRTVSLPIPQFVNSWAPKHLGVRSGPKQVVVNEEEVVGGSPRWESRKLTLHLFLPTRGNGR